MKRSSKKNLITKGTRKNRHGMTKWNQKGLESFYQVEELIKRELVPPDWTPPHVDSKGRPVKYPIKHVSEIIRKRLVDGSEWILSRQFWTALNQVGNAISIYD